MLKTGNLLDFKNVLRQGPIAAEISGGKPIFKFYKTGIIDDLALLEEGLDRSAASFCATEEHGINHAVLIVGFGYDETYM